MSCPRCYTSLTLDSVLNEKLAGFCIESLICPVCSSCISLKIDGVKKTLEEVLENQEKRDGWHSITAREDYVVHYALSQVVYRRCERPRTDRQECVFDLPDPADHIRILWSNCKALGFYTLKMKGTLVEYIQESYEMVTLDTAYISSTFRGKGYGLLILEDIVRQYPQEDIGFSTPIALPMLRVIEKFIKLHPEKRYKLWEVTGAGCEGSRKLVWWSVAKHLRDTRSYRQPGRSL